MGEPVGMVSGRTFNRMSTHLPNTCWSSLSVTPSHTLNMSIQSPSEALKSGLPMSVSATARYIYQNKISQPENKSNIFWRLARTAEAIPCLIFSLGSHPINPLRATINRSIWVIIPGCTVLGSREGVIAD